MKHAPENLSKTKRKKENSKMKDDFAYRPHAKEHYKNKNRAAKNAAHANRMEQHTKMDCANEIGVFVVVVVLVVVVVV
jgi:hypothetical protein